MTKRNDIERTNFALMLKWLDENDARSAEKYEMIRDQLIKIFLINGYIDSEDLADKVFDRVCSRIQEISETYDGKKELYFYGVAKKIKLEALKRPAFQELPEKLADISDEKNAPDITLECLEECLGELHAGDRKMILHYYQHNKSAKIEDRKIIAEELGLNLNSLRLKIYRLRNDLRDCVLRCMKKK